MSRNRKLVTDEIEENDYQRMHFDQSHAFTHKELVIVPRSKGGFSYGYIEEMKTENVCQFDHMYAHQSVFWVVRLFQTTRKTVTKILPTYRIGKLLDSELENEGGYELVEVDDYQSVLFDREIVPQSSSVVCPYSGGGLMHCLFVGMTKMRCKCPKHEIDAVIVDTMLEEMVVPVEMCGVLMTDDGLSKRIIIDCGDMIDTIKKNIETMMKSEEEKKESQETSETTQQHDVDEDQTNTIIMNSLLFVIKYYKHRNYMISLLSSDRHQSIITKMKENNVLKKIEIITVNAKVNHQFFITLTKEKSAVLLSNRILNKVESTEDKEWISTHQVKYQVENNTFKPDDTFKYPVEL